MLLNLNINIETDGDGETEWQYECIICGRTDDEDYDDNTENNGKRTEGGLVSESEIFICSYCNYFIENP